ncbi:tetraacyldisaccharide 4'-kinase [Legionella quinlivanii]|uniref:Tetraacyldisaccharide 4'-kinase n=2 Tax=Legionella quinlivanii TaxID=45073 RepID=A0A0W0XZD0_9GAMM|nr:tetraacyldisaccharide 4'-kinase [Legionella quinlivanii]KTD50091.1 tetraacyldisaccharide 4'-kinase [Legionella quinlivanii]MCW8450164.1 tetraacyldisaccharide 4'-kinase [Legionella quinlivanii]SEF51006.1 lipid-A-disaccharide kinase [Legionella quinlivanii DSM 21216]STY11688.1 tetraacyldisaccharide 4'-kinase [Legionella quinlivanii]
MIQSCLEKMWYGSRRFGWLIWPLSLFYQFASMLQRFYLRTFKQQHFEVPVIVVGNLSVGGVGKTPLVVALVKEFQSKGLRVGVVSRGYGASITTFPHEVLSTDTAVEVGDEPLLLACKLSCPVVIAPKRVEAIRYLLEKFQTEIIISDDGLQHYRMGRAIEIVVIDGLRGLGNGFCLPAGPLRERPSRLKTADLVVVNGGQWQEAHAMSIHPGAIQHLASGHSINAKSLEMPVAAVAGIGHPARFFTTLKEEGIICRQYPFPDHFQYNASDLCFSEKTVIMTEKDAVKCKSFAADNWYFLPVEARLAPSFWQALWSNQHLKGYQR